MKKIIALLLALFVFSAHAQNAQLQPFQLTGNTVTVTAAASAPTPVQASAAGGSSNSQYVVTNSGAVLAFVSFGTSAQATAGCVIPTGTSQPSIPVLPLSQISITTFSGSFFCGVTASSTAVLYITPGQGS